jgi:hypothetical protein
METVFILLPSTLGGIKSSSRRNRIETGKNLNPVQKIWGEKLELLGRGGNFPPKMPRVNTGWKVLLVSLRREGLEGRARVITEDGRVE